MNTKRTSGLFFPQAGPLYGPYAPFAKMAGLRYDGKTVSLSPEVSKPPMHRAGFIAIVGRPNVGKSTLLNALLGQKVAITSPRVQTTRHRIRGVLTLEGRGQIVFLDTPGISKPMDKLGEFLSHEAEQALNDADSFLLVVDGSLPMGKGDQWLAEQLKATGKFIFLLINKIDRVKEKEHREKLRNTYLTLFEEYPTWDYLTVSAITGKRLQDLPRLLLKRLPEAPPIYAEDDLTDQRIRDIAQEMIREKAMLLTEDELPHGIAVFIEKYDESDPDCTRIYAIVYVDQKSQKGMVIGKNGQMIKQIGQAARKDIEELVENKVFLDLQVKVKENWRRDLQFLKLLGLSTQGGKK
jgi:GTPase